MTNIAKVIELAKNSPDGFTVKDVKKQIKGVIPNSLYALMWKLKRDKILSHDKMTGKYTLVGDPSAIKSTRVYKSKKPKTRLQSAETALPSKGSYEREIRELGHKVHALKTHVMRLEGQHHDALAIIRYLEDKLFKAIQFDARNGSNS